MDALIFAALLATPFINWPVAIILIRLARIRPTIRALTERAMLAFGIAVITTIYALVALNTQVNFPFLTPEGSRFVVRVMMISIGLSPLWWLWSYYMGRFHVNAQDDKDEADKKRDG